MFTKWAALNVCSSVTSVNKQLKLTLHTRYVREHSNLMCVLSN